MMKNVKLSTEPILFSIIVAACDVERYIKDAIDSIKNQTVNDFEVLMMCDKSNDNTLEVCRVECDHDDRFAIYPLPRSGSPAAPRNAGVKLAKGRYVLFLDGDDWLECDAIERFRTTLIKTDYPDMVFASLNEYNEDADGSMHFYRRCFNLSNRNEGEVFSGQDAILQMWHEKRLPMIMVYSGIYRLEFLLEHNLMQMSVQHEDNEWSPRVWFFAQRATVLDTPYYNYRRRPNSITTLPSPQAIHDLAKIFNSLFDFYFSHDISHEIRKALASQWLTIFFWYFYDPKKKNSYPKENRKKALSEFLRHQGFRRYIIVASKTGLLKRVSIVFFAFYYWFGSDIFTTLYFKYVYFPYVNYRVRSREK